MSCGFPITMDLAWSFRAGDAIQMELGPYEPGNLVAGSTGAGYGDVYRWNYVIGTGETWNGPIAEFYLIKPSDWEGTLPGLKTVYAGFSIDVLCQTNYAPSLGDRFSLRTIGLGVGNYYSLHDEIEENSFARPIAVAASWSSGEWKPIGRRATHLIL